ncbi:MAG: hypothetical protein AB8F74_10680 [Saprospiraceae bacterium]
MNLAKAILNYLTKKETPQASPAPEGLCPNCWGRQEYEGHFYEAIKQENLDVTSKESNVGWINAYANKYLTGIALVSSDNGEELICPKCKTSYQHKDEHTAS